MQEATVYADVQSPELRDKVAFFASSLAPSENLRIVFSEDFTNPLEFINCWEKEQDDISLSVNNNVPFMRRFECFITDSKTIKDGAVAYALYYRNMPVLSLTAAATSAGGSVEERGEDAADCDWITAALYNTVASLGFSTPLDAIAAFFTFPATSGKVLAVESDCAALAMEQSRFLSDHMRCVWNMPVHLVGPSCCDLVARSGEKMERSLIEEKTEGGTSYDCDELEEEEEALYAHIVNDLLNVSKFQSICDADPQLHGALLALNRHHNLRIMRYRLQRGANVILCFPLSSVFEKLVRDCGRKKLSMETTQKLLSDVVKSIQNFEFCWLKMPKRETVILLGSGDCADVPAAHDMDTVTSSTKWTRCVFADGNLPVVDSIADWHVVSVSDFEDGEGKKFGRLHNAVLDVAQLIFR